MSKRLVAEELLLPVLGPARLRMELDRTLWRDRPHIRIKQLWEHLCSYLYLPRLKDQEVLLRAIQEGTSTIVASDAFAYAEGYDEDADWYVGLRLGGGGSVVMDSSSLLLKPEVAREKYGNEGDGRDGGRDGWHGGDGGGDGGDGGEDGAHTLPKRFYASVTLDPERVGRDAGRIADEVLSHLSALPGTRLTVSMEIGAEMLEGAPEDVQRTVSENSQTLKFDSYGFWKE